MKHATQLQTRQRDLGCGSLLVLNVIMCAFCFLVCTQERSARNRSRKRPTSEQTTQNMQHCRAMTDEWAITSKQTGHLTCGFA
jgi:hypothetical protein